MPRGKPGTGRIKPIVPITHEMKVEAAKAELMEKMVDPKNVTPEKMPNFASLDSYGKFLEDDDSEIEVEDNCSVEEIEPEESVPKKETEDKTPESQSGKNVPESPGETFVFVKPKVEKKRSFEENLKAYNKLKDRIKELEKNEKRILEELSLAKSNLEEALSEKKRLEKEAESLSTKLESKKDSVDRKLYDKVLLENEELLLKNSELELAKSILSQKKDVERCERASERHTYSNPGYSGPKNGYPPTSRPAMNGYQDWI